MLTLFTNRLTGTPQRVSASLPVARRLSGSGMAAIIRRRRNSLRTFDLSAGKV
jgi:hypothetical protein